MSDFQKSSTNKELRNPWNPPKKTVELKDGVTVTLRAWEQKDLPMILDMAKSRGEIDYAESDITCFIRCRDFYGVVVENSDGVAAGFMGFMKYGLRMFTVGQLNVVPLFREKGLTFAVISYSLKSIPTPHGLETFHYGCKENNDYYSKISVQIDENYGKFYRMTGTFSERFLQGTEKSEIEVRELKGDDYSDLIKYDESIHTFNRSEPIHAICSHPTSRTFVAFRDNTVCGYGIFRIGRLTNKVAPLFADGPGIARSLYRKIGQTAPSDRTISIIAPSRNEFAMDIIQENNFELVDERWRSRWNQIDSHSTDIAIDYNKVYSLTGLSFALC